MPLRDSGPGKKVLQEVGTVEIIRRKVSTDQSRPTQVATGFLGGAANSGNNWPIKFSMSGIHCAFLTEKKQWHTADVPVVTPTLDC